MLDTIRCWLLATRSSHDLSARYIERKSSAGGRGEREREREGERGGSWHAERVQGVAQLCVRLCVSLSRNPRLTEKTGLIVSVVASLTRSEKINRFGGVT